uniref:Uncharacterized protein n=1 Tax=Anguilla anguilla TaxID=7936 RepID=A0A0E9SZJ1_ANGAN
MALSWSLRREMFLTLVLCSSTRTKK